MSRPYYFPKHVYIGTGGLATYSFDFKIEALTQLLIVVVNDVNVEVQRVLGTDNTYLSGVTFDSVNGGGTVTLLANLPASYKIAILQANDEPSQSFEFSNKTSFSLKRFENALDFIVGPIQRLSFRARQSFRIHDLDDEEVFNTQLPPGIVPDAIISIDPLGTKIIYGPTVTEVEGWKDAAEAAAAAAALSEAAAAASEANAAVSEANAAVSETNAAASEVAAAASAAAAAASAASVTPKYQFLALQTLNNNDQISVNALYPMQMVYVQGNGGDVIINSLPFVAPPDAGAVLTIMGRNDLAKVILLHNDVAGGLVLNEDEYLGNGQSVTVVYDPTLNRYFKLNRSF